MVLAATSCGDDSLEERQRLSAQCLRPLLETDRPKTCNQCHLSGVDLSLFVRSSMCETRACLVERSLVNTANIDESPVLAWIQRANPESGLITEDVIAEEYEGFREFLTTLFACDALSCQGVHCTSGGGSPTCGRMDEPLGVTLNTQASCAPVAVEQAFKDTVYVWRDRCFPCHHTDEPDADRRAPRWIEVMGGCDAGAATTLRNVIDGGYMDLAEPTKSWLLLKPLSDQAGGIFHAGGQKFEGATRDAAYLSFLSFIEYYARCDASGFPP
jgi:hypothetical protein